MNGRVCLLLVHGTILAVVWTTEGAFVTAQTSEAEPQKKTEQEYRVERATRPIRNEDLKNLTRAKVSQSRPPAIGGEPAGEAAAGGAPSGLEPAKDKMSDERDWRIRFQEARLRHNIAQEKGLLLELKANELRNRFFTESDGSTRSLIEQQINAVLTDIESNKNEAADTERALEELKETARKAGIPPAWMEEGGLPSSQQEPAIEGREDAESSEAMTPAAKPTE